jgi:hypothetical protein
MSVNPPGGPRHTWKDNIQMDLQDVGCGGGGGAWTESFWFRIGTGGGHL